MYIFQNFQAIFTKKNFVTKTQYFKQNGTWGRGGKSQATIQELADHENEMEMFGKIIQSQRG